jgi:hypothetical protein
MASTTFVDLVGPAVNAAWLNDVNNYVYGGVVPGTGINASTVTYDPAGTGAVATTVQAKLRESVSVKDFGAVGDGVTNDTTAIQAAIDHITSLTNGGSVFLPKGIYAVSTFITLKTGVTLRGEGPASVIYGAFPSATNRILTSSSTVLQENITVEDLTIDRRHPNSQHGAIFGGVRNFTFRNVSILGQTNPTISSGAVAFSAFGGFEAVQSKNVFVENVYLEASNNFGIAFGNVSGGRITGTRAKNCYRELIGLEAYGVGSVIENVIVDNNILVASENPLYHFGGSVGPIMVVGCAGLTGTVRNCQILNNTFILTEPIVASVYAGALVVVGGPTDPVEDCVFDNLSFYSLPYYSVSLGVLGSITRNCTFSNISVFNNGGSTAGPAITLRQATGHEFDGIRVKGTTHTYAVLETTGADSNTYMNVRADAGTTGNVLLVGASSKYSMLGPVQAKSGSIVTESVLLADGATYTFSIRGTVGRAMCFLMTDFGPNTAAVFSTTSAVVPTTIFLGTDSRIGLADPNVAGALNIFMSTSAVSVHNRLGSARNVVLHSVATA